MKRLLFVVLALSIAAPSHGAPQALSSVRTRAHALALTFDDGPDPVLTPMVLALLKKHHAHATFFVTGSRAVANPALIGAEHAAGELGDHSWDHADMSQLSRRAAAAEIDATQVALGSPVYFRPPYGRMPHIAPRLTLVRWSVSIDRFRRLSVDAAVRAVMSRIGPGSIILAHDGCPPADARAWCLAERTRSLEVLDRVLTRLESRGWKVLDVTELRGLRS